MTRYWILIAESSRADLFSMDDKLGELKELDCFVHPASRAHAAELTTDTPGQGFDGKGAGQHALSAGKSATEQEAVAFAREMAMMLDRSRIDDKFDQLVVVSPPHFLGLLRKQFSTELTRLTAAEIDKNLVKSTRQEITQQVHATLYQ